MDTPGFSNLKFDFIMPQEVDLLFDDISRFKNNCKYQDCLHISETDCSVLNNLDKIDITRYNSYVSFVEEAKLYKDKVKNNGTKQESCHKINNNSISVKVSSRKRQSARNTLKQKIYKEYGDEEFN